MVLESLDDLNRINYALMVIILVVFKWVSFDIEIDSSLIGE